MALEPTTCVPSSRAVPDRAHSRSADRHSVPEQANGKDSAAWLLNVRMMHTLERITERFNQVGIPLMVLKGAALHLTLLDRPDERPMTDVDLLIKPEHYDRAFALLEDLGGLRGESLVREDFFPRFHYEIDYTIGNIYPVKIDLHVRPFRPLRYSRLVPDHAFWERAVTVRLGRSTILVPCDEHMLIHLGTHAAIHGVARGMWLEDIPRFIQSRRGEIDWDLFLKTVDAWRLTWPIRKTALKVEHEQEGLFPQHVLKHLSRRHVGILDRLALWQAPRDYNHPSAHVAVDALCTPGWRFKLAYLRAVLIPSRTHMDAWYCWRHWGWLPCAYALRFISPLFGKIAPLWRRFVRIETKKSPVHGTGVFAACDMLRGTVVTRYRGRHIDHDGVYVGYKKTQHGQTERYELTGKLRFLNHSCRPNAAISGFELIALKPIKEGDELLINYGEDACSCESDDPVDSLAASA